MPSSATKARSTLEVRFWPAYLSRQNASPRYPYTVRIVFLSGQARGCFLGKLAKAQISGIQISYSTSGACFVPESYGIAQLAPTSPTPPPSTRSVTTLMQNRGVPCCSQAHATAAASMSLTRASASQTQTVAIPGWPCVSCCPVEVVDTLIIQYFCEYL